MSETRLSLKSRVVRMKASILLLIVQLKGNGAHI